MLKIYRDPETLLAALADFVAACAGEAIAREGRFNVALSGGGSPKKLYELLASASYRNKLGWKNIFFFFGDERCLPPNHPDSNFFMAKKTLFEPLNIAADHVFTMDTTLPPADCAKTYEENISRHFKTVSRFDLVLLGLGNNSHTASLFPHTNVLHEKEALIKEVFVEEVKMYRVTFTPTLINLARTIAFLVYGASKAEAVRSTLEEPLNVDMYPAQLIRPEHGELIWFLDEEAAARIRTK